MSTTSLLIILASRFTSHMHRHEDISWDDVVARLESSPTKMKILEAMESSGGEPDVVGYDEKSDTYIWYDCAAESPAERRSLCYDDVALDSRKANKPAGSAVGMASDMGVELLTESDYRHLQTLGEYDLKTSSWIATLPAVRALGGAIFCDRRFDTVFTYHNGAESYYAGRGWRGKVSI